MSMLVLAYSGYDKRLKIEDSEEIAKIELPNTENYSDLFFEILHIVRFNISECQTNRAALQFDGYTTIKDIQLANNSLKLVMFSGNTFQFNKWKAFFNRVVEKSDSDRVYLRFRRR